MTTPNPNTTGQTLEQLLDSVIFSDPATHALRDEWERTKAEEQAVFERVCREEYEGRKMCHEICKTPDPDAVARHETNLLRPMLKEELDARLTLPAAGRQIQRVTRCRCGGVSPYPQHVGEGCRRSGAVRDDEDFGPASVRVQDEPLHTILRVRCRARLERQRRDSELDNGVAFLLEVDPVERWKFGSHGAWDHEWQWMSLY